jgi:hypothetical protein
MRLKTELDYVLRPDTHSLATPFCRAVVGTTTALIMAGIAAAGSAGASIYGATKASDAATQAADTQATAAEQASKDTLEASKYNTDAILQAATQANSLAELQSILGRMDTQPYRDVGGSALMTLQDLMQPGGYLAEGYPEFTGQMQFNAGDTSKPMTDAKNTFYNEKGQPYTNEDTSIWWNPEDQSWYRGNKDSGKVTALGASSPWAMGDVGMDPGFDFRMAEGQKALERSAASKGTLLSGGTAKALERYAQDYSSGEYNNAYNRTYGRATDAYNQAQERYRTNYAVDSANKSSLFGRISGLAGIGSSSAGETAALGNSYASNAGSNTMNAANNAASVNMNAANNAANYNTSAAAARASGYVGSSNAWANALSGIGSNIAGGLSLYNLLNKK